VVGKVNVDAEGGISMKYGIRNIPTLLIFKDGEIVDKQVGVAPKQVLANKLEALI
ncbi:MAG: thioredoxin family protein, partial [Schleiferiaceae bacterium]|nr:thioredoxin family protein [Schleiferiaceae bacterium]